MAKWNDPSSMSFTFDMKPDEESKAFFQRMLDEYKERDEAFKERIKQLFDEHIGVGGEKADEAYSQVLQVFAIGYQCGWNDLYSLNKKEG